MHFTNLVSLWFYQQFLLLALTLTCAFAARLDGMRQMQIDEPVARRDIIIIDNDNSLTEGGFPNLADAVAATLALTTTALSQTGLAATLVKAVGTSSSFVGIPTWPRTVAWATIAVVNTAAAATGLLLWLQCTPVQKTFQNVDFGFCWPGRVMIVAQIVNAGESISCPALLNLVWACLLTLTSFVLSQLSLARQMSCCRSPLCTSFIPRRASRATKSEHGSVRNWGSRESTLLLPPPNT